ncbi:WXG100 family type VII secretion target [Streptomyces oceani]|uniref:ESAT-6-like protein n=1 Tax=Streptomyces oceani TaxID=1075402 RepID=A0A1E7JTU1_9ACTN|nr:WXG100 family type VII secretion target [Streptomyces oceani]OEU92325.1 hypothetical protein AN216_24715 [Streptomyces oceani]
MTIQITYGTVTAAAEDIRSSGTQIASELQNLDARVQKVVNTWDGAAKAAYYARHQQWSNDIEGLTQTLSAIATALYDATDGYKGTDKKAADQFQI